MEKVILNGLRADAEGSFLKKDIESFRKDGKSDSEIDMYLYMDELQTRLSEVISLLSEMEFTKVDDKSKDILDECWRSSNKMFDKVGEYIDEKYY